ncbi:NAD(P)H dehydrogenase (quinone) FQR1-like [Phalaenopsis equestris]|uniref:NAD(P)H dehydrogenase (quinone) FQR1-like n=1 Tax=Phalaenopsis equestris TaxID=78828 RepID=UPI0009E22F62|nr:NAD(P)H dehydrogenase (quinone) FQR1-like [Phalaenopsis equestris]
MGKGAGCMPSKHRPPAGATESSSTAVKFVAPVATEERSVDFNALNNTPPPPAEIKLKIFIVFYSMYGHVESLARRMKKGVDETEGTEGLLYRVPETLSEEVLGMLKVPLKEGDIPVITAGELAEADGILFGFPTRFGSMAAQMKAFFDSTGELWKEQRLAGKPAGFFVSTGTQGGGQETTAWTAITQLAHHGMLFVPIGYTFGADMFTVEEIRGGSPYGAGVFAGGDGGRSATEAELQLAEHQGKYMASIVKKIAQSSPKQ